MNVPEKEAPDTRPAWDVPKVRPCLRCGAEFQSAWSGERICARCKSTSAWRQGVPAQTSATGRRG